ncbi:hypothetical protein ACQ856_18265 [Mycolicibacterium psychrotolerans]
MNADCLSEYETDDECGAHDDTVHLCNLDAAHSGGEIEHECDCGVTWL